MKKGTVLDWIKRRPEFRGLSDDEIKKKLSNIWKPRTTRDVFARAMDELAVEYLRGAGHLPKKDEPLQ